MSAVHFSDRRDLENDSAVSSPNHSDAPPWLDLIRQAVSAVDFGTIQIKVHNREVVQIEATRKIRVAGA